MGTTCDKDAAPAAVRMQLGYIFAELAKAAQLQLHVLSEPG